jgi:hypothetical protein
VILFFAGAELAISTWDIGSRKEDFYVMLVVGTFAMWNMGLHALPVLFFTRRSIGAG